MSAVLAEQTVHQIDVPGPGSSGPLGARKIPVVMRLLETAAANRQIARLEGAWASASLGTWAFSILLALYAYQVGGVGAVGAAALARMLPSAVAAAYTAMLVDRHSRRAVLIVCALARSALIAGIGLAVAAGAPFAFVLVLAAAFTAVSTAHKPAQAALLPQVARTPDELAAANICWSIIDNGAFLAGSLAAGALAALASLSTALTVCAIPFLVAAAALTRMPVDPRPQGPPEPDAGGVRAELLMGFRTVGAHPELRLLVGVFGADMLIQAMVDVLLVIAALEVLQMGPSGVGWLSSAWGLGGLAGGAAAMVLLGRGRLASGVALGCVLAGLPLIAIGAWPAAGPAIALLAALGVGFAMLEVALLTLTQRLAADDVLGRVYGVQEIVFVIATALGSVLAAALVAALGGPQALIATGLVLPILALALRRRLGTLEAGVPVPERAFRLLRELPMFSTLPIATVENLASRATTERFPNGAAIVVQGDPGAHFYVIDEGTVEARADDMLLARLSEREFFGEIALLRDIPRVATVRAVTPVGVLVIGRGEFLTAITAHPHSVHALEGAITDRLTRAAAAST